ncbi:DIS3-like exonuclease 1 [Lepeophtheirus salmonis]|uniref:DIS3-like exonuclease 1 n=1 Tax=Lepeophtheirus salmonis TaxID=72036 RepID=UPI001AE235E7|nr:DIS3-like exonuclease 1 [Lepeophtheirus salmonis]XP_040572324.1 DIS3-like exonuclease 1 [Lepeophtheirus salmonis]
MGDHDVVENEDRVTVVDKRIQLRLRGGQVLRVVRQHYLRKDIPCGSELCFEGCQEALSRRSRLPKDATHYLVPFSDILANFMPILEYQELTGIIFLQSVVNLNTNSNKCRRVSKIIRDPKKASIYFPNEFSTNTFEPRMEGQESYCLYQAQLSFKAASWYYEHLGGQKPIVILTENIKVKALFENKRYEIFFLSLEEYLKDFWPNLDSAFDTYKSLKALDESSTKGSEFEDYIKTEMIEAGIKSGRLLEGILRVNKYHSTSEAFVTDFKSQYEIFIPGHINRNRAVDGDVVAINLLPKSEWVSRSKRLENKKSYLSESTWERKGDVDRCGKVVGIIQRNWREYVASYQGREVEVIEDRKTRSILVVPFERKIPKIRILTSQNLNGQRFVVAIDNWPSYSNYPIGHFVRRLGDIGDLETEIDCLLMENNISVGPFSSGILNEMPNGDNWKPDPNEVSNNRNDLRHSHFIMSIDPQGCEDVDDALSIRTLKNGNLELGVHIADVTYFVKSGSLTDKEASQRATTVYLADRRYDMLPSVLSGNLCSLLGGVERYAVTVLWELDPKDPSTVISVWYGRTLIRSRYKLTYEAAQTIIDGNKSPEDIREMVAELKNVKGQSLGKRCNQLREMLTTLCKVALEIQKKREKEGGLSLESTEAVFEFESSNIEDLKPKEHLIVHEVVAECMIFANHWVAKKISKAFPDFSLLRRHPYPKREYFEELINAAKSKGWNIETYSNKALADSLNSCRDPNDLIINILLRTMATLAMVKAVYFSTGSLNRDEWYHYGLAVSHYTHFTSPIRRYADVVVHRLLLAALKNQNWWDFDSEQSVPNNEELSELCIHINDRNKAAQKIQRASAQLFQTLYFKNRSPYDPGCIVEAVISSIKSNGFIVYIPRYALKGPVYLSNAEDQVLWHDKKSNPSWETGLLWTEEDNSIHIETLHGKKVYKLFDHVTLCIQLSGTDAHAHSLTFHLLSPKPPRDSIARNEDGKPIDFFNALKLEQEEEDNKSLSETEEMKRNNGNQRKKKSVYSFFKDLKKTSISTNDFL